MEEDISGSILLGSGVLASVVSRVGSTEYNLEIYHQLMIALLIVVGATLLAQSMRDKLDFLKT